MRRTGEDGGWIERERRVTGMITCKNVEIDIKRVKTNDGGAELQGMLHIDRDTIQDRGAQHYFMNRVRSQV